MDTVITDVIRCVLVVAVIAEPAGEARGSAGEQRVGEPSSCNCQHNFTCHYFLLS